MPQSRRSFISAPFLATLASQPLADVLYTNVGSGTFGLVGYTYQPNGTDDADAIQHLLNEAAKRGGSVLLKSGQEPYRLGHRLELPDHASLSGESPGTSMVALRSMDTMLEVDAPLPLGNRLGTIANLVLDGAGLADTGVSLKACVQRSFGPLAIPEQRYFVLGDNRNRSYDSRFWGPVSRDKIYGLVHLVYFSWDYENTIVRWNRIGKLVE